MVTIQCRAVTGAVMLTILSLSVTSPILAQSAVPAPTGMPLDDLRRTYLECERAAVDRSLHGGGIMMCSVVYEELKHRAFDGDFPRLKAWADQYLRPQASD